MTMQASNHAPSVWAATAEPFRAPKLADGHVCDCLVIGGGFTGLRAALALAESGSHVVLTEAHDIAWGASGRNGGQVNPMLPLTKPRDLQRAVGPAHFERLTQTSLGSADELFAFIEHYQIECDARQKGWLRVNHCEKARKTWWEAAKAWNAHGAGFEFLETSDVQKMMGSKAYRSGTLSPKGGAVHPLKLASGVAKAATARGAKLFSHSPVTRLERQQGQWHATVNGHPIAAQKVILATNGYTGNLVKGLAESIIPLVSIQIATDPLPENMVEKMLSAGQTVSDTRRMIMYARREPDNRVLYGGIGMKTGTELFSGFEAVKRDAIRIFPELADVQWNYQWGGQIAFTVDHVPHLHEPAPGLLVGFGYNGRGVAMAHVMGRVLAERALGRLGNELAFPVTDIRSIPLRKFKNRSLPLALQFMRWRDGLEFKPPA